METTAKTIELEIGHFDGKGVRHTRVTFGKRLRGRELFEMDADQQSDIPTQHQLMIYRGAITEFGTLPIPVPLTTLLKLDVVDLDALMAAYDEFLSVGTEGRIAKSISESEIKLALGYENNGIIYDHVIFGNRLTGMDLVAAEKESLDGLRRECFLIGRQIKRLSSDDGAHTLDGPIELQIFEKLDGSDIVAMRAASLVWRRSFRSQREKIQGATREAGSVSGISS